jgi:phosphatidylserine/phosphatidylglycerophosphate/cardiolipin synthase-like enzyme
MEHRVELIVQPDDGITPILSAIDGATSSVDLMVFRFDLKPIEKALKAAVDRGVAIRALIANTSSDGEKRLRQLELRLLQAGITVSRTGTDLVRYHGKLLIIDRETLHVYGFNYTRLDLVSRSFGVITEDRRVVSEAVRLFEADSLRQEFEPAVDQLVVSPENAREQLATFIKRSKKQLLIYDPKIGDMQMIRLLTQRIKAGVDVRVIGKVAKRGGGLKGQKCPGARLHVRAIVRDGDTAFVGSQSLRPLELDGRREVGLITKNPKVVKRLEETFEADWAQTEAAKTSATAEPKQELAAAGR